MNVSPRTQEEQHEYVTELVKLSLFFSSEYNKHHSGEDILSIIIARSPLWELTGLRGSELETRLTRDLAELYGQYCSSTEFEKEGMALLSPHMDTFFSSHLEWEKKILASYNDSCFKYDPPTANRPPNHCNFHITNNISPESILKEDRYTASCFMRMMDDAEKEFGFDTLRTETWLNSVPQWLKFFPGEWIENMNPPVTEITRSLGLWGQLITARKTFNFRTAEYIRANAEMRFKPGRSWCSFKEMKKHLERFF